MSEKNDFLFKVKKEIDDVSPSFCIAKWLHATIHLTSGNTHSCFLPKIHKIPNDELENNPSALHNTLLKKIMRKMMLEGIRPKECVLCWSDEDNNTDKISDRCIRSSEDWAYPYLDEIKKLRWDENINPKYLELGVTQTCNLKCCYCSPHLSSSWEKEILKFGHYNLIQETYQQLDSNQKKNVMPLDGDDNIYFKSFWKWLPTLYPDLKYFRITGGEPLLASVTFKILEWISEHPQSDLNLSINSNLAVSGNVFNKFLLSLKNITNNKMIDSFILYTSIDTFGEQAEYIRHGLNLSKFTKNVERYLTEFPNESLSFICTFNILSIPKFKELLSWILCLRKRYNTQKERIFFDIPLLDGPEFLSIKILPKSFSNKLISIIEYMESEKGFYPKEIVKMKKHLAHVGASENTKQISAYRAYFHRFFTEHDIRRNLDFLKVFPDLKSFWDLCKNTKVSS